MPLLCSMSQSPGLNIGQQRRKTRTQRRPWCAWYAQNCCKKQTGHHCLIAVQPQSTRLAANTKPWTDAGSRAIRRGSSATTMSCATGPCHHAGSVAQKKKAPSWRFSVGAIAAASPSVDSRPPKPSVDGDRKTFRIKKRPPPPDLLLTPVGRRSVAYSQVGLHALLLSDDGWPRRTCRRFPRPTRVHHVPATRSPRALFSATP